MLSLENQNKWRQRYQLEHPDWKPATEQFAHLVQAALTPETRLLDVGCGRGGLVEQLALTTQQVVGIDPDWSSLHTHRLDIWRVQGESDWLPFAPQSFDLLFCSWVFEHLQRPLQTFQAVHRVLKPGGLFIFITPNGAHPLAKLNQLFGRFEQLQGMLVKKLYQREADDTFATHYRANTRKALTTLASETNLKVSALNFIPDPTYLAFSAPFYKASCWLEAHLPVERKIHLVGVLQKPPHLQ